MGGRWVARARGVTLLEVLVVLAVAGIVAAIAVSTFAPLRARWRLHAAARELTLALRLVRAHALARGRAHRLRVQVGSGRVWEEERAGEAYVPVGPARWLPRGVIVAACTARGSAVTFQPRGHASTFGTVRLRNRVGEVLAVVVNMAGRVRLEPGG